MITIPNLPIKMKALRILRGMHQRDLVKITGIHQNLIVDIERGRAIPAPAQLAKIEAAFGIEFDAQTEAAFATLAPELQEAAA